MLLTPADEAAREVHKWVLGPSLSSHSGIYEDITGQKLPGTCEWITKTTEFQKWAAIEDQSQSLQLASGTRLLSSAESAMSVLALNAPADSRQVLWIHGPAGFGKTYLTAHVIQQLEEAGRPVAHFFFSSDLPDRHDPSIVLRSWLSQLASKSKKVQGLVTKKWLGSPAPPTRSQIAQLLQEALEMVPHCYLVIDGLDECTASNTDTKPNRAPSIPEFLDTAIGLLRPTTRILVVSRGGGDIRQALWQHDAVVEFQMEERHTMHDCGLLSEAVIDKKLSKKFKQDVLSNISTTIKDKCGGQMLWIHLAAQNLKRHWNSRQLLESIKNTPEGLDNIYEDVWKTVSKDPRSVELLRWVTYAVRPLTIEELTGAVLVVEDDEDVWIDAFPDETDEIDDDYLKGVLEDCGQFLTVRRPAPKAVDAEGEADSDSPQQGSASDYGDADDEVFREYTVHLIHDTVRPFLIGRLADHSVWNNDGLDPKDAPGDKAKLTDQIQHRILGRLCLWAVSSVKLWESVDFEQGREAGSMFRPAFGEYAADAWIQHIKAAIPLEDDEETMSRVLDFMNESTASWNSFARYLEHVSTADYKPSPLLLEAHKPAYYAIDRDVQPLASVLLKRSNNPQVAQEASSMSLLLGACCLKGSIKLVNQILDDEVDVNQSFEHGRTAIQAAAQSGSLEVVSCLIERGATVDAPDNSAQTALHFALDEGHVDVAKTLVEHGADASQIPVENNALLLNKADTNLETIAFFMAHNLDLCKPDKDGDTPLHTAASNRHLDVVSFFLEKGVPLEAVNNDDETAIHKAAFTGDPKMLQLFISHGANIHHRAKYKQNLIHKLVANHDKDRSQANFVQSLDMLIDAGLSIQDIDCDGETVVHTAIRFGCLAGLQAVVERGADFQKPDDEGDTPARYAIRHDSPDAFKYLVEQGAKIDMTFPDGSTLPHEAARRGDLSSLKILAEKGVYLHGPDNNGEAPLNLATEAAHVDVIKFLVENGAHIFNCDWRTPLLASGKTRNPYKTPGFLETVKLLVAHGANINGVGTGGATAVTTASRAGKYKIVAYLLENGASVDAPADSDHYCLHAAAELGRLDLVKLLLRHGADVNRVDIHGSTALHSLCKCRNLHVKSARRIIDLLVGAGIDVDAVNGDGMTALNEAAHQGHVSIVVDLLQRGADFETSNSKGRTAILGAAEKGSLAIFKLLLEKGAVTNLSDSEGLRIAHLSAWKGHLDIVRHLFEKLQGMPELNLCTNLGWTPVNMACSGGFASVVKYLGGLGADLTIPCNEGDTPLVTATFDNNMTIVRYLVDNGVDVNVPGRGNKVSLCYAVEKNNLEMVRYLVEHGADTNIADFKGNTPLLFAADHGFFVILKYLVEHGADIHKINEHHDNAISFAAEFGHWNIVKYLGDLGTDVNCCNVAGGSPMILASDKGYFEIVQYLLDKGAPVTPVGTDQDTPLGEACYRGRLQTVKLLLERGSAAEEIINARNMYGSTALLLAAENGHFDVVKLLVEAGADIDIPTNYGSTPLLYGANCGNMNIVKLLVERGAKMLTVNDGGYTMVGTCVVEGELEILKYLFEARGDEMEGYVREEGWRLVQYAAVEDSVEMLEFLVDRGLEMNRPNYDGDTAVDLAERAGNSDMVDLLRGRLGGVKRVEDAEEGKEGLEDIKEVEDVKDGLGDVKVEDVN